MRLFSELTSAITVDLDDGAVSLEEGLSLLMSPDRDVRRSAAEAVTVALEPGLRTRGFVFNTLLVDKSIDDRLRHYDSWIASRNLSNEASDESVDALVTAVQARYDIPQRWYSLKARLLGLDKIADYDRMASVASVDQEFGWTEARDLVLDAYASFSPDLAAVAQRFFDESWIDAPIRPGKRPGAFCAYTVPSRHPYLLLNWTSRRRDVLTLAHEMGHGLHAYLARDQGIFHQTTPLTLAETASVFGETVTFGRLLNETSDPEARLALLAESLEGQIATVFRQVAMNRFEDRVHNQRRDEGELSVDQFNEAWADTQRGDARRLRRDHRRLPHVVVVHPALHGHTRIRVRVLVRATARAVGVPRVRTAGRRLRAALPRDARGRWVAFTAGSRRDRRSRPRRPCVLGRRAPDRRRTTRGRRSRGHRGGSALTRRRSLRVHRCPSTSTSTPPTN